MADYIIKLTPDVINLASEGSLDTSVTNGVSIQRSIFIDVYNNGKRKVVEAMDGVTINDTIELWSNNENLVAD